MNLKSSGGIEISKLIGRLTLTTLLEKLIKDPLSRRQAKAIFWSGTGTVLSRLCGLLLFVFIARFLGQADYGKLGIINSTLDLFNVFAGLGLGSTAAKYVSEFKDHDRLRTGRVIGLTLLFSIGSGSIMALLLVTLAPLLAEKSLADPQLTGALRIAAIGIFGGAVTGAIIGSLGGFEAFKDISKIQVAGSIGKFPIMIGGTLLWGLNGAILGLVSADLIACAFGAILLRRNAKRRQVIIPLKDYQYEKSLLWRYSLPTLVSTSLITPAYWILQSILVNNHGYTEQALYTVGAQWRFYIMFIPNIICVSYFPIASSMSQSSFAERKRFMLTNAKMTIGAAIVVSFMLVLAAPLILRAYGEGFVSGANVFRILAITAIADAANIILLQTILSSGKAWLRLFSNTAWLAIVIPLGTMLIPSFGAMGLALALLIGQFLHLAIQTHLALHALRTR